MSYFFKIATVGDGGIGKTTLLDVYCGSSYFDHKLTVGLDFFVKEVTYKGKQFVLQLWDFGGQDQFRFMHPIFFEGANCVLLGFDCSRIQSFVNLNGWMKMIRENCLNVPVILISYKIDKGYHLALNGEMISKFMEEYELVDFIEVSAKEGINIDALSDCLLEVLRKIITEK